jgi:excisionase family DNA binding protein
MNSSNDRWSQSGTDQTGAGSCLDLSKLAATLQDAVKDVPSENIPVLMTELATVQTLLAARLLSTPTHVDDDDGECITLAELADRLKMGESTVRAMVASGELRQGEHYARKGRKLRFFWSPIRAWLRQADDATESPHPAVTPFLRKGARHA